MSKRTLLLLAIVGVSLFWSGLIAELSLRYFKDNFLVLFLLVTIAVVSTSYLTYQTTRRNELSKKTRTRRQTKKQSRGNKTSFKSSAQRTSQNRGNKFTPKTKTTPPNPAGKTSTSNKSRTQTDTPKATETSTTRTKGRVRVYYTRRSYGFVEDEKKQTVFFHKSAVDPNVDERDLTKKPNVTYLITPSDRGPVATEIQLEQ